MTQLCLGLDLGTSGVRLVAVDKEAKMVAETTETYPLLSPKSGWTEQEASAWVTASLKCLKTLTERLPQAEFVALGLSGQMHGMLALDKQAQPLRPALLWNDQRTQKAIEEMLAAVPKQTFIQRTGNPPVTGFHLSKLIWLRQEEPANFKKTTYSLLPKDYLAYYLTGAMHSEPSDNSGTNCFHLASKTWDKDILSALGLSQDFFPNVIASTAITGYVRKEVAELTGLPKGLPVIAGASDNAAAAAGLGLMSQQPELGSLSLGTSGVLFAPVKAARPDPEGRVHLFCHADGGYMLLGVTLSAAGSLQWYRDTFVPNMSFDELFALASHSSPGAKGVCFKPYLAGERTPHMNPDLRGSWTGLSLATTQGDIIRSVLEGVAFSLRDAYMLIKPLSALSSLWVTGGGARSELWVQMLSDVLGLPLRRPKYHQGAAYGAALLAFDGVGLPVEVKENEELFQPGDSTAYTEAIARYHTKSG